MATTQVYPVTTIAMPTDIQAHTNELFDFNDEYLVQNDIKQEDFVRVYDRTGVGSRGIASKNHWLFQMNDTSNASWYAPSRSYLKMDFRIIKTHAAAPPPEPADINMQTFCSDLRCAFKRVRFGIAGQTVTDIPDYFYAWVGQDNCFWTQQYLDEQGQMMLCYPKRTSQPGMEMRTCQWASELTLVEATAPGVRIPVTSDNTYQNSRGKREYLSSYTRNSTPPVNMAEGTHISCFIPLIHCSSVLQYMDKAISLLEPLQAPISRSESEKQYGAELQNQSLFVSVPAPAPNPLRYGAL